MNVKPLFKLMVDKKASDLFFTTYAPVMIKIDGKIMPACGFNMFHRGAAKGPNTPRAKHGRAPFSLPVIGQ